MRDDFDAKTKEILARRVGYRCSNPECGKLTSGPQEDPAKALNIGVGAHITAASEGGPRYDPSLSSEERAALTGHCVRTCGPRCASWSNTFCAVTATRPTSRRRRPGPSWSRPRYCAESGPWHTEHTGG